MKILLVEDDSVGADLISTVLKEGIDAEVVIMYTESEFYASLEQIGGMGLDLIILDVQIRWQDPSPEMESVPAEVLRDGYYRAGLRCATSLSKRDDTSRIPIVFMSAGDLDDIGFTSLANWRVCPKSDDMEPLLALISTIVGTKKFRP